MASLIVVLKIDHEEVDGRERQKQETQKAINTSMVVRVTLLGVISGILKEETTGFTKCTGWD